PPSSTRARYGRSGSNSGWMYPGGKPSSASTKPFTSTDLTRTPSSSITRARASPMSTWTCLRAAKLALLISPGTVARDPVDSNPGHVTRRRVGHRRKGDARTDVDVRESLEQLRRPTLRDPRRSVDDRVVAHADGICPRPFERERDPRVALDVPHLLV